MALRCRHIAGVDDARTAQPFQTAGKLIGASANTMNEFADDAEVTFALAHTWRNVGWNTANIAEDTQCIFPAIVLYVDFGAALGAVERQTKIVARALYAAQLASSSRVEPLRAG